ncbi:hypothetical protein VTP01DRAFT_3359 [Rhizomucor pusillus]|uniref:uncharacterized protein n=1 Tax=Rhizomucor pusillus TaxID=4840 RepID=UPI0037428823
MARPKAKQSLAIQQCRSSDGTFQPIARANREETEAREDTVEHDLASAFDRLQPLSAEGAKVFSRNAYVDTSRITKWRNKKEMEEALKVRRPINSYFQPPQTSSTDLANDGNEYDEADEEDEEDVDVFDWRNRDQHHEIHDNLQEIIETFKTPKNEIEKSHAMRYLAVRYYIVKMLDDGLNIGKASLAASNFLYEDRGAADHTYRGCIIRRWANEFFTSGIISPSRQGRHAKRVAILSREDVESKCIQWLKERKPMERDLNMLKKFVEEEFLEGSSSISIETIRTYLSK